MAKLGKTKNIKTQVGRSFLTITVGNQFYSGKRKMFFIWNMKLTWEMEREIPRRGTKIKTKDKLPFNKHKSASFG